MKIIAAILFAVFLQACSGTVIVKKPAFPAPPEILMKAPEELKTLRK